MRLARRRPAQVALQREQISAKLHRECFCCRAVGKAPSNDVAAVSIVPPMTVLGYNAAVGEGITRDLVQGVLRRWHRGARRHSSRTSTRFLRSGS